MHPSSTEPTAPTAEEILNKLWAALSFRFIYDGGETAVHGQLNATDIKTWCDSMGWEYPEGLEEAMSAWVEGPYSATRGDGARVELQRNARWVAVHPHRGKLRNKAGRVRSWKTVDAACAALNKEHPWPTGQ